MNCKVGLIVPVVMAALVAPAAAERFELGIATGARYTESASVDALTGDDSHPATGIWAGVRLPGLQVLGFDLIGDVEYEHTSLEGTTFSRIDSEMGIESLRLGGRARRLLGYRTSAFARLAFGWLTADLDLTDRLSSQVRPTSDRAHGVSTTVGGGLQAELIRRPRLSFGLRADLDYTEATALGFDAAPEPAGDDALEIPVFAASLGDVDLSGWSLRFGAFARF